MSETQSEEPIVLLKDISPQGQEQKLSHQQDIQTNEVVNTYPDAIIEADLVYTRTYAAGNGPQNLSTWYRHPHGPWRNTGYAIRAKDLANYTGTHVLASPNQETWGGVAHPPSVKGHMLFGPYILLNRGTYRIQLSGWVMAAGILANDLVGTLEVRYAPNGTTIIQDFPFFARDFNPRRTSFKFDRTFRIDKPCDNVETRFLWQGTCPVIISSIKTFQTSF